MNNLKLLSNFVCKQKYAANICQVLATQRYSSVAAETAVSWNDARSFESIPSVSALELMAGNLSGGKFKGKDIDDVMRLLHKEKGDIFLLKGMLGQKDMLFTQNAEDFEKVYRFEGAWPQRMFLELAVHHRKEYRKDFFGENLGLLAADGKSWGDLRAMINPILMQPKNVKIYLPTLTKINQDFIDKIREIRDPKTLEVPDNFSNEINRWTLESVGAVALDTRLGIIKGDNPDAVKFFNNNHRFFNITVDLEFSPSLWRYLPSKKFTEAMEILDYAIDFTTKHINEALARIEKSPSDKPEIEQSVLEKLLKIDKKIAIITAMEMFIGGVDTTSTAVIGLLLCLAKNPEKQQKLREEVIKILPEKDSELTVETMKNLPYLRACIKESLRMYPLALANIRQTVEDLVLSGYQVPKSTRVNLFSLDLWRNEKHFSQPNEFLPERWLRADSTAAECPHNAPTKTNNPFVYLPFGFGPRSCVGRRIAEMEIEIAIARIVRNFNVEFNYSTDKIFQCLQIFVPAAPLKFKFTDLD